MIFLVIVALETVGAEIATVQKPGGAGYQVEMLVVMHEI